MSARAVRPSDTPAATFSSPQYEARLVRHGAGDTEVEVWHLPPPASPQVPAPIRVAGLRGRNLELVEARVLKLLAGAGVRFSPHAERREARPLAEEQALRLALLFRALAPMRCRDKMRAVADGIEAMGREEAGYWLGMALHRRNPRRVLTALRLLMTDPYRPGGE